MGYNGGTASRFNRTKSHSVRQFYRTLIMCFLEYLFSPAFLPRIGRHVLFFQNCNSTCSSKNLASRCYESACWLAKRLYDQP